MANSPSHKFGQIIGDLLEEIMAPELAKFCTSRNLYLDKKGIRGAAREGKKVTWDDKFGNSHDLDFVIEQDGSADQPGRPLAFIEAAWRRYTKHSRNKAQEIQGAILPIAEKHDWDKPFLGAVLAGVFTEGSLTQLESSGFEVMLFPYETIVEAFKAVGVDAAFDESTADTEFQKSINKIEQLSVADREKLKSNLVQANKALLEKFLQSLTEKLDRQIRKIFVIPLHGSKNEFNSTLDAISFISNYNQDAISSGTFAKYELIVRYNNNDHIDASFSNKDKAIEFLKYIGK